MKTVQVVWQRYRWLRLAFLINSLGGIPVVSFVGRHVAGTTFDWLYLATGLLWWLLFGITGLWMAFFRCPRCRKEFFEASWFARRCHYCGLPKWSGPESSAEAAASSPPA